MRRVGDDIGVRPCTHAPAPGFVIAHAAFIEIWCDEVYSSLGWRWGERRKLYKYSLWPDTRGIHWLDCMGCTKKNYLHTIHWACVFLKLTRVSITICVKCSGTLKKTFPHNVPHARVILLDMFWLCYISFLSPTLSIHPCSLFTEGVTRWSQAFLPTPPPHLLGDTVAHLVSLYIQMHITA